MENHRPLFLSFVAFLILLANPKCFMVAGEVLPIVDDGGGNPMEPKVYIVHVQKPKGTRFLRFRDRRNWYMSFLPNMTLGSGEPRLIYAYRHVISGFAARLTGEEVELMEGMDGFLLAYPEGECVARTTYSPQFLGLSQMWTDGLWYSSNEGSGQIIGVVDTGVDPTHPSFNDQGMPPPPTKWGGKCYWGQPLCNNKLIGAVGYKRGVYTDPLDDQIHGSHVASTAAGNFVEHANLFGQGEGTASGMAPKAHLAIYKALFKDSGKDSDVLKCADEAIRDGVDVLSMSLGDPVSPLKPYIRPLHKNPVAISTFAAMSKGIVPSIACGNVGPHKSLIDNDAPWAITVGASSMDRRIRVTVRLGNGVEFYGESVYQPENSTTEQLPLVHPGVLNTKDALACNESSLAKFDLKGKIVLCHTAIMNITKRNEDIKKAGGAGILVFNQRLEGNTTVVDTNVLPSASMGFIDGEAILHYLQTASNPTAAILFNGTVFGARPSPAVASLSSRGPSLQNGGIIKPDIIAPGISILAAWPKALMPNQTYKPTAPFVVLSGTSMATPHISGIVALLRNNHPNWSPAAIKSAMMTTADALDLDGKPIADEYNGTANVFAMGSGHVNPRAANDPGLIYDLQYYDYVHYMCGIGYTDRQVSAITRGSVQCSQVKAISVEDLNYPSFIVFLGSKSRTKTVTRTVTNVGEAGEDYSVQFDEPAGVSMVVSPSTLHFSQVDEKQQYKVTFSFKSNPPAAGTVSEGQLTWISGKHSVRSPIAATFT